MTKIGDDTFRDERGAFYSVTAAARIAGTTEDEVRRAIDQGVIAAEFLDNLGDYVIPREEVIRWVTHVKKTQPNLRKRVIVVDPNPEFAEILVVELNRLPNVRARLVAGMKDVLHYAELNQPDLILACVGPSCPEVVPVLREIRGSRLLAGTKIIVYTPHSGERARAVEMVKELKIGTVVDRAEGSRVVLFEARRALGVLPVCKG